MTGSLLRKVCIVNTHRSDDEIDNLLSALAAFFDGPHRGTMTAHKTERSIVVSYDREHGGGGDQRSAASRMREVEAAEGISAGDTDDEADAEIADPGAIDWYGEGDDRDEDD